MNCAICDKIVNEDFPSKCLTCKTILCDDCALKFNFKCNICNKSNTPKRIKVKIDSIRRSYIELYKKCPHAFNLQVVEHVEVPGSVYTKIGIKLHDMFDNACKQNRVLNDQLREEMIYEFAEFFKEIKDDEFEGCQRKLSIADFKSQQYKKGLTNIDGFINMCYNMPSAWKTEETLTVTIPDTSIKATLTYDRINKNHDGTYDLLDYKSGKVYVGQDFVTELQPPLYIYGVEQNYGIKIDRFVLLFTGEGKERIYNRINDDEFVCMVAKKMYKISISEKIKEISAIFQRIESGEFEIPSDLHQWYCENECGCFKVGACAGKFNGKWKGI